PDRPHRYTWRVYRVATGEHVGTFLYDGYSLCAGVLADRVFVVEYKTAPDGHGLGPELHAMELKTGKSPGRRPPPTVSHGWRLGEKSAVSFLRHDLALRLRDRRAGRVGERRADDERHVERPQRVAVELQGQRAAVLVGGDHHRLDLHPADVFGQHQ